MGSRVFRYFSIIAVLIGICGFATKGFAVAPTVTDMVNMGHNLDYIATYIITHAPEFEPYTVEVAKVFLGSGTAGAVTGAAALSTWSKFAAMTAWGLVAGLATYDIVKGAQLIGALVELSDIKKGIATVREVQRFDRLGIQMMGGSGGYQEWYVRVRGEYYSSGGGMAIYYYYYEDPQYFDGDSFVSIPQPGHATGFYYSSGNKKFKSSIAGASGAMIDFAYNSGVYAKTAEIFMSGSASAPAVGIWELYTPQWGNIYVGPTVGTNAPLFSDIQPVGVVTTPSGASLLNALTPEQWGNVRSLQDIAPILRFEYLPYSAYRNIPSYDVAGQEVYVETSQIVFDPNTETWSGVNPQTILEVQQQLQTLTQTVQSILADMEQVQTLPELQEQVSELQQTQVEIAGLVETLSQTLTQAQTEMQANTETLEQLQTQYQEAVELMNSVQTALETVNQVQSQIATLTEQVNGVITENDVIVRNLNDVQTALETIEEEYPQLKADVQSVSETLQVLQTQVQTQGQAQAQTQEQYENIMAGVQELNSRIQTLSENMQNVSVSVDLSPVVEAVNEVSAKVDALSEQVQSLQEYLEEGFFEKLAEKMTELLEELFVPDPEAIEAMMDFNLPEYGKQFGAEFSFSSESVSIPIQLYGASVDLSSHIRQYSSGLKHFMNLFVSAIAAVFVIRAFRVHLNID